jgi:hypothetical protein
MNKEGGFPSLTVLGGILGAFAGFITGAWVLAPAAALAGLGADTMRCDRCGSDRDVHQVMIETEDHLGQKIYRAIPRWPGEDTMEYTQDELQDQVILIEDANDCLQPTDFDMSFDDSSVDCDISYDFGDTSFEMASPGEDGFGDSGSDFGMCDGGDFGSTSGGGEGAGV